MLKVDLPPLNVKHFSTADAWLKKISGSRKDHILPTIFYQSLCHWVPETAGSRPQKYVQLITWSSEDDYPVSLEGSISRLCAQIQGNIYINVPLCRLASQWVNICSFLIHII